jgi:hypothetical protein
MVGRVSKGALAAGVVAWVTPEILIARPTAAGAMSAPPDCRDPEGQCTGGGDTGNTGNTGNTGSGGNVRGGGGDGAGGPQGGTAGSGGSTTGPGGSTSPGATAGGGGQGTGSDLVNAVQPVVAASGSSSPGVVPATAGAGSNGSLPFAGLNAFTDAEVGGAMVVGGWLLTRWSGRRGAVAAAGAAGAVDDPGAPGDAGVPGDAGSRHGG